MTGFINDCMAEELKHVARCGVDPDYCMAYAREYGGLDIPGVPFKELTLAAIRRLMEEVASLLKAGVPDFALHAALAALFKHLEMQEFVKAVEELSGGNGGSTPAACWA